MNRGSQNLGYESEKKACLQTGGGRLWDYGCSFCLSGNDRLHTVHASHDFSLTYPVPCFCLSADFLDIQPNSAEAILAWLVIAAINGALYGVIGYVAGKYILRPT